jgi:serine/threonine protein kinase
LKLGKEIGRGGGGVVYRAKYLSNVSCAVKVVTAQGADDGFGFSLEDVVRETAFLKRLDSPFIVDFIGVSLTEEGR